MRVRRCIIDQTEKNHIKRQWLRDSLKAKQDMLAQYVKEAERLEAEAASLRGVADEIETGIRRTESALRKLTR